MAAKAEDFKPFHAGLNLSAQRRADGLLHPYGAGEPIADWPQELEWCGNVFGLEEVIKGNDGFEEGVYA